MMMTPPAMQNPTAGGGPNQMHPMFVLAPYGRPVPPNGAGNATANTNGTNQNNGNQNNQNQNQSNSPSMMPCYVPCFLMPHPGAPGNPMMPSQQQNMGEHPNAGAQGAILGGTAMGPGMALYPPQGSPHPIMPHPAGFMPMPYPMPSQPGQEGGMDSQHAPQHGQGRMNRMNPPLPFLANTPHGHPSPVGMIMPIPMQPEMDQQAKNDFQPGTKHMQGVTLPRPVNHDGDDTKRTAVRMRGLPYDASAQDVMQFFKGLSLDENSVVFMPNKRKSSAAPGAPVKRGWGEAWVFFPDEGQAAAAMERRGQHVGSRWIELKLFTIGDSETEIWRAYANSGAFDVPNNANTNHGMDNNFMTTPAPYPGWDFNGARGNGGASTPPMRMNGPTHPGPHHQALHPLPLNSVAFGGGNAGQGKGRMGTGNVNKRHANISVVTQNTQNNGGSPNNQNNNQGFGRGNGRSNGNNVGTNGRGNGRGMQGGKGTNSNASSPDSGEWNNQTFEGQARQATRPQPSVQPPPQIQTQPPQQPSPQSPQPQSPLPSHGLLGSPCIGSPQTSPAMQPQIHSTSTPLPLRTLRGTRVVLVDDDGLVVPSTPATAPATAPAAVLHSTDPDAGFASLIAHDYMGKQPEWMQQWRNAESAVQTPVTTLV